MTSVKLINHSSSTADWNNKIIDIMKTRFFALATLALALAACNNDNENLNGAPVAAQFTANIAPATRASGTTWTGGDRIGITDIGNDTQYGTCLSS